MTKGKIKKEEQAIELVADSEQSTNEVANCDLKITDITALIRIIRGVEIILDSDLAMLYGVENKRLNEQVKRNISRFPDDFMFQLNTEETKNLKSQIATSSWGGKRKNPYAFTRNGIAMLSSVLRSETAIGVNIRIMRAFPVHQTCRKCFGHHPHPIQRTIPHRSESLRDNIPFDVL